jgi:hypothetical protein
MVHAVRVLGHALPEVMAEVSGSEPRVERLRNAKDFQVCDSAMFEIATAAAYARTPGVQRVRFVDEGGSKSPDIAVEVGSRRIYVECKRFNRANDFAVEIEGVANALLSELADEVHRAGVSVVIDVDLFVHPDKLSPNDLAVWGRQALSAGVPIIERGVAVSAKRLPTWHESDFILFPSPRFDDRYDYVKGGDWHGIVPRLDANFGGPSWVDEVHHDCAIKWRVRDPAILRRQKRLAFKAIFDGLDQLRDYGTSTVLHVCFERNLALGHRREVLMELYEKMKREDKRRFGWLIFNEMIFDVDQAGYFRFDERCHPLSCRTDAIAEPVVYAVFGKGDSLLPGTTPFGE